jgi:hypothetical protein
MSTRGRAAWGELVLVAASYFVLVAQDVSVVLVAQDFSPAVVTAYVS